MKGVFIVMRGFRDFDGYGGFGHPMMFGGIIAGIFCLIFLAILAVGIIFLVKYVKGHRGEGKVIDILNERFARGEIEEEEYKAKKALLTYKH